jgi:CheY-like chemotaxis protein
VQVTVRDTGIGIPAEMRERIFDMFAQVERPAETPHTGLGIGLTLVRSLIEMHGGSVQVQSDGVDRGSEFQVRLPIVMDAASTAVPSGQAHRPEVEFMRRRVLVVDDNAAALDTLALMLEVLGHEVRTAHDGSEAITRAEEFRPEVVLMDLGMPNVDGYAAAREIRARAWGREVLLVATTGWGQEDDRRRTREAGFDHHLVKPVDADNLRRILNGAVKAATASALPA